MIAKTILQQIGGKRFTAMTGSRDFIDMGNGLRMSLQGTKQVPTALTSSMTKGQTSTICASTAGRSAKRPLSARQRTLPYTRYLF